MKKSYITFHVHTYSIHIILYTDAYPFHVHTLVHLHTLCVYTCFSWTHSCSCTCSIYVHILFIYVHTIFIYIYIYIHYVHTLFMYILYFIHVQTLSMYIKHDIKLKYQENVERNALNKSLLTRVWLDGTPVSPPFGL